MAYKVPSEALISQIIAYWKKTGASYDELQNKFGVSKVTIGRKFSEIMSEKLKKPIEKEIVYKKTTKNWKR